MSFITKMFGDPNEKELKALRPIVDQINALEDEMKALTDEELRERTADFKALATDPEVLSRLASRLGGAVTRGNTPFAAAAK